MYFLRTLINFVPANIIHAHCDIPCGVYDVQELQMAAHTVIRMIQLLGEKDSAHDIARLTRVKEKHGEIVEEELGTLENDYFKPEHFEKYPELRELLPLTVNLSIKIRQNIDAGAAKELLESAQKIAEIFYKTKNLEPIRVASGYPTGGEIVMHK